MTDTQPNSDHRCNMVSVLFEYTYIVHVNSEYIYKLNKSPNPRVLFLFSIHFN